MYGNRSSKNKLLLYNVGQWYGGCMKCIIRFQFDGYN
jgi:hypothetical protein